MNGNTEKEVLQKIKSDYARYGRYGNLYKIIVDVLLNKNHSFNYCFWLRLASEKNFFSLPARKIHKRLSYKHGIQISPSTRIGYGLCLGHGIGIVINPTTVIGDNCNICHFTTIGSNHGKAAVIGDNVYIGPNVCIVENIKIGNNVTIGAGSVVVKDVPDNATVAGVPARILSYNNPGRYVRNRYSSENISRQQIEYNSDNLLFDE